MACRHRQRMPARLSNCNNLSAVATCPWHYCVACRRRADCVTPAIGNMATAPSVEVLTGIHRCNSCLLDVMSFSHSTPLPLKPTLVAKCHAKTGTSGQCTASEAFPSKGDSGSPQAKHAQALTGTKAACALRFRHQLRSLAQEGNGDAVGGEVVVPGVGDVRAERGQRALQQPHVEH